MILLWEVSWYRSAAGKMLYLCPLRALQLPQAAGGSGSGWCWDRGGAEEAVQTLGGCRRTATVGIPRLG